MKAGNFLYDSTMSALYSETPYWPYTVNKFYVFVTPNFLSTSVRSLHLFVFFFQLDHSIPHKCHGNLQKCPTKSFPGMWSMVMNEFDGSGILNKNERSPVSSSCAMVDSCNMLDAEQFYNALSINFQRHYETNRAPLGIYMHAAWFIGRPEMFEALLYWIDQVLKEFPETYFVSMSQAIEWMKNPTKLSDLSGFGAWKNKCSAKDLSKSVCPATRTCVLKSSVLEPGEEHRLISCADYCPASYPWTNDFLGRVAFNI